MHPYLQPGMLCFRKTVIPGSYKVLPPIEKPLSREEFQQNPNQSAETVSDGYLGRMEKQRQMKTKVTYKVGISRTECAHDSFLCCTIVLHVFHQCWTGDVDLHF